MPEGTEDLAIPIRRINEGPDVWSLAADVDRLRVRGMSEDPTHMSVEIFDTSEPQVRRVGFFAIYRDDDGRWGGVQEISDFIGGHKVDFRNITIYNDHEDSN